MIVWSATYSNEIVTSRNTFNLIYFKIIETHKYIWNAMYTHVIIRAYTIYCGNVTMCLFVWSVQLGWSHLSVTTGKLRNISCKVYAPYSWGSVDQTAQTNAFMPAAIQWSASSIDAAVWLVDIWKPVSKHSSHKHVTVGRCMFKKKIR